MKTAVLIGCGSKFGLGLTQFLLQNDWQVYLISGSSLPNHSNLHQLTIDWHNVTVATLEKFLKQPPAVDLVFFNQNSSALSKDNFALNTYETVDLWKQEKTWSQSYFVSCILPFHVVHTLGNRCSADTKIGWMLSDYVHTHKDITHADYIGNKYQNYLVMKNFAATHPSCCFGVNPDDLDNNNDTEYLMQLLAFETCNIRSKVVKFNGTIDTRFDIFNR